MSPHHRLPPFLVVSICGHGGFSGVVFPQLRSGFRSRRWRWWWCDSVPFLNRSFLAPIPGSVSLLWPLLRQLLHFRPWRSCWVFFFVFCWEAAVVEGCCGGYVARVWVLVVVTWCFRVFSSLELVMLMGDSVECRWCRTCGVTG